MSLAIRAGRRSVEVPRPDKPLFPDGITKADLARYYEAVAGAMLPHVAGRPLNLERFPDGIDGEHAYAHTAVTPYAVRARPKAPVATPLHWDELADSGTRPDRWTVRTLPDRLVRDGDPWAGIRRAARPLGTARRRLDEMGRE